LARGSRGEHHLKLMVFSGDNDSICSTAGTQEWIWSLGFDSKAHWQAWHVKNQTAGYYTIFDLGDHTNATFSFITVHGAGHEVPAYRPVEAFVMLHNYLEGLF
jgi:carboxypeptidase C (cathepsin A)